MKLFRCLGIILALACLQSAVAQDTMWICRDTTSEVMYSRMYLADTFPDNRGMFRMVDTGDALDGNYVNFDYQFSQNSVYEHRDTAGGKPDTVFQIAPRPGYAGFKFFWDYGASSFWVKEYDSMILWHKGPLSGHKVMMIWASGSAGCGSPILYEYFGQFYPSSTWQREAFGFPPGFLKDGLYELRMLINNDSIGSPSPTSAPGDLKIDNMCFKQGPPHAPVILTQPQSKTIDEGCSVKISIYACGGAAGAATYQWLKDGDTIPDVTWYTYVIDSVKLSDAGSYTVVATNSMGSVTSNAAILTVNTIAAPVIQTQPQSQTVDVGSPMTFTVVAVAGGCPSYQWLKDGDTISGATASNGVYSIDTAKLGDAGSYTVVVTNVKGSVTSNAATLKVNLAPTKKEEKNCGCGSGTGLALIPPLFFKAMAHRKRKKKNPKT